MKKVNYLLSLLAAGTLLVVIGCSSSDSNDEEPAIDLVGKKFAGTWTVDDSQNNQVDFQGDDRTSEYGDFELTVSYDATDDSGSITTSGANSQEEFRPFDTSDTWSFKGDINSANVTSFSITRSDEVDILVTDFSDDTVTLSFNLEEGDNTSRTENIYGNWTFKLKK